MNTSRIVAAITSVLGVVGLGLTMLPLISVNASSRIFSMFDYSDFLSYALYGGVSSMDEYWEYTCEHYQRYCPGGGGVQVDISGYDLIATGYTAGAVVPIALALGVAAGGLYAWRGADPRVFTFLSLASVSALFVLLFTWVNPSIAISGSGELGTLDSTQTDAASSEVGLSVGAGLYLPAVVLTVIFAISAWQAVSASDLPARFRRPPVQPPMMPTARV